MKTKSRFGTRTGFLFLVTLSQSIMITRYFEDFQKAL